MSLIQVMKCDVCGKLLPDPDASKGIHTDDLDFCESCIGSMKREIKDVKSLRAYHVMIDIVAKVLIDEAAIEEEEKKNKGTTGTSGFAPAAVAAH